MIKQITKIDYHNNIVNLFYVTAVSLEGEYNQHLVYTY